MLEEIEAFSKNITSCKVSAFARPSASALSARRNSSEQDAVFAQR